jgi:hypothetical protein
MTKVKDDNIMITWLVIKTGERATKDSFTVAHRTHRTASVV